jgi:hypothetical protein
MTSTAFKATQTQWLQPAPRTFSTAFGFLMAAAAQVQAHGLAFVTATSAMVAVLLALRFRTVATLAVLLTMSAIVLSDPSPLFAALSGLCATAYLVLRHATSPAGGLVTATPPTMIAAVGFALVGVVATSVPLQLPWLPLLAPVAVFAIYALAVRPFLGDPRWLRLFRQ